MSDTPQQPITKEELEQRRLHTVTMPSGAVYGITLPNLAELAKGGQLPNELLKYAIPDAPKPGEEKTLTDEEKQQTLSELADFQAFLIAHTVVQPDVAEDEVHGLVPTPDIEMLVEFALRQRDTDAIGHQIGGLEKVESFRRFRGLDDGIAGLVGS